MDNPLISIIIPAYNIESYIATCLNSVLNQSYKNLEIIVINDGSKDNTAMILNEYEAKDSRIKVINKNNTGVSDTRNIGIDSATGDYIGFVDGDDTIHPDMYKILLDNAVKYNAEISHCGYQMVFPNRKDDYYGTEKFVLQDNEKGIYDLLSSHYVEPGLCNKLFKKSLIENIRLNKEICVNEDLLFNYYAFKKSKKSVYEDRMMYYYMARPGAANKYMSKNKLLDPIKVLLEIANQEDGIFLELVEKRLLYLYEKIFSKKKRDVLKHISIEEYKQCSENTKLLLKKAKMNRFITQKDEMKAKLSFYFPYIYRMIYWLYDLKTKSSKKYQA